MTKLTTNELMLLNVIQGRKPDDTPSKLHITESQWKFIQKMKSENRITDHEIKVDFND